MRWYFYNKNESWNVANTYLLLSQTKSKQLQDKTLPQITTGVRRPETTEALSDQSSILNYLTGIVPFCTATDSAAARHDEIIY